LQSQKRASLARRGGRRAGAKTAPAGTVSAQGELSYQAGMKLGSARLVQGALLGLLVAAASAACGSDDGRKHVRDVSGGAAGAGGDGGAKPSASAGDGGQPEGGGGQPLETSAGQGGMPPLAMAGEGGTPPVVEQGGAPAAGAGGAGGAPDVLPPINCEPVVFADSNLEDAIRTAIDKVGPLTLADIASLTTLDARGYGVADLGGIECFSELTDLDLGYGGQASNVTDLTPLRYLKKLGGLDLTGDPVTSLEPLGQLPQLQVLRLSSTSDLLDLTPLGTAKALVRLDLVNNALADLTPLGKIATLDELWLNDSTFTVPNSLSALTNVKKLYLSGTALTDATPLAALPQLTELNLDGNSNLTNFNKLSTLVNLTYLDAGYTGISSVAAVASMTKLQTLYLYSDNVADITPLQGLTQLQTLALNFNPVTDITPLVANAGIAAGDSVNLAGTGLNCTDQGTNVTALINRQVTVYGITCN
jgi:Leucine-rich repeat (LRR) protein